MKLDRYDRAIVHALQLDGRITNSQLAETVSLSESACLRRVRALEESGFIEGYTALINQQKAGCPVNVFVNITLDRQEQAHLHAFEEAARKVPEVMECYLMSGEYDYLLRVVLADTADFERLHSQHLTRLPHVARVQSSFALRTVQKSRELPIAATAACEAFESVSAVELQRESHLDRVGDPFGAFPVALADAEIQPLELGRAREASRRRGGRRELELDGHVLGDAAQRKRADRGVARGRAWRHAAGHVMGRREMRHVEDVRAAHGAVAILVAGIRRIHVDRSPRCARLPAHPERNRRRR